MTTGAQLFGDLLGGGHGQAVDDARTGQLAEVVGQPADPLLGRAQSQHRQPQRRPVEGAAHDQDVVAQLVGDVAGDPLVGGRGGGQHRSAHRELGQHRADPAVVGPEVVTPVGDAVGLVDHEHAGRLTEVGQHLVAEARVVEPLRTDQQHVDRPGRDVGLDRRPGLDVGGVDRGRADAGPLGRLDLVAHQRQQGRDDHRRTVALLPPQRSGHEVDRRLAPAGALHDQGTSVVDDQGLDGGPLVVVQPRRRVADERGEVGVGLVTETHAPFLPTGADTTDTRRQPARLSRARPPRCWSAARFGRRRRPAGRATRWC